jgi:hypothetical protein
MIAGVPWQTWLLLVLSVGIGLTVMLRAWSRGRAPERASDARERHASAAPIPPDYDAGGTGSADLSEPGSTGPVDRGAG